MSSDGSVEAPSPPAPALSAGFERLDTLVRVTTIQSWVYLATLFAVGVAAVAFAVFYRVPTKVMGEGILLIEDDAITQVRAQATGRLVGLRVKLRDPVAREMVIGEISQDDLKDAIHEAELKLKDLEDEHLELTRFEHGEQETHGTAMDRVAQATGQANKSAEHKLTIAERMNESTNRLRMQFVLGDLQLLESREKMFGIRDDINKGITRLAELDLEKTKAVNARLKAQLDRRLKIKQLQQKLTIDREKMARTSRIVSRFSGTVAQVVSTRDELVREGAPVVLLHSPKSELGVDDEEGAYDSIVFVPAGEGKKINKDDVVEVSPATVKRAEYGFIRGHVVSVSELPATKLAMESALQHSELVDTFLKRYAPGVVLRVHVKLDEAKTPLPPEFARAAARGTNRYEWSSSYYGRTRPLKTGTMCQAAIVVDNRRLISLVLPWTKELLGAN
jgi:HlyD family secretion protein